MNQLANVIQIIISLGLSTMIFLQVHERNNQLNLNSPPKPNRGWEKVSLTITFVLLFLFTLSSTIRNLI